MSARQREVVIAEQLHRQGHTALAVKACFDAFAAHGDDALAHALMADVLLSQDFYEQAIEHASLAIEIDPDCAPAYLTLGLAYDRRGGMWDQSILVWHELAEVVPDLVTAHVQLGEALAAAAFEEEAIDAWRQAVALDAHEARAMYNLAVAALKREGMATALPGFRKAGELDPSQDDFFFALSGVYDDGNPAPDPGLVGTSRRERLDAAFALAFEEEYFAAFDLIRLVLDENAADSEALALAAYLYLKQDSTNEAMACALRSLAITAKNPAAVYALGVAFAKRPGLSRNAARVFGALAAAVPDHPMPHVLLAESLLGLQRYDEAKDAYVRAVDIDPSLVRARFGLAAVLYAEGEHSEAGHQIRRAAFHDTRRQGLFWQLYDDYAQGRD